jgi:predicted nuclease of predicted toxin-antitoxin system
VRPLDFSLLADENIHPDVVAALREEGHDIQTLHDLHSVGQSDRIVLETASRIGRIVLTHDSDFGRLLLLQEYPSTGIIYPRPGHILSSFTLKTLKSLRAEALDIKPPFIVAAQRSESIVRIRVGQL